MIDPEVKSRYSESVYSMAVSMYKNDHGTFLSGEEKVSDIDEFKKRIHKAKSGALMLGFSELSELLIIAEDEGNTTEIQGKIAACYKDTLQVLENGI